MIKHGIWAILALLASSFSWAELRAVEYRDGKQALQGWLAEPAALRAQGQKAVLILPAWKGVDNEARQAAEDLQAAGYLAMVADIYGRGNTPSDNEAAKQLSGQFKSDYALYQRRIRAGIDALVRQGADPKHIAVIGYCFGGTGALEAARGQLPVQAVVSIHGGLGKGQRAKGPIVPKVLVLHGAEDASVPESEVEALRQELRAAGSDWQLIYYAGSKHTFTNPESPDYNAVMSQRAWQHTLQFLAEVL